MDTQFIDVELKGDLPKLSHEDFEPFLWHGRDLEELQSIVPLELFRFEGFRSLHLQV